MTAEFRLPPETHIGNAHLRVSNLDRSLRFYVDLLGFSQTRIENGAVVLASSKTGSPLILLSENRLARPKPPRTTGLYHVAIRLPNHVALARLLRRLIDHDFPLRGFANHGVSEAIYLSDPDSNGLELYVDLPRKEWSWVGGQIQMSTDPLDVEALLASGEEDPSLWNGIHPDTDIGHIHLQVGDLVRTEQFYHDALGFNVTQRSYPGALFVAAGDYHHHIGLNIWAGRNAPPPPSDAVGLISFSIEIPDASTLDSVIARLRSSSGKVTMEKNEVQGQSIEIQDNDGIVVNLLCGTL